MAKKRTFIRLGRQDPARQSDDGQRHHRVHRPYKQYIGGMGIANKIMYDEVPAGTDPLSREQRSFSPSVR